MSPISAAEALFASPLQPSEYPDVPTVRIAIGRTLRRIGATGCVEVMAVEFGEHPEVAAPRMRWALDLASAASRSA
jgi:hypothetical protein